MRNLAILSLACLMLIGTAYFTRIIVDPYMEPCPQTRSISDLMDELDTLERQFVRSQAENMHLSLRVMQLEKACKSANPIEVTKDGAVVIAACVAQHSLLVDVTGGT